MQLSSHLPYYGWIVTAACFCLALIGGVFLSFGVVLDPLMREFGWSNAVTSSIYSVYWICWSASNIFMGLLVDRYSPRRIMGLSAFLIGLGLALSYFASALWHLYLFFGVIGGIGTGGIWVPASSLVMRWFGEGRAMNWAVSFVSVGVGMGTLIFAPLEGTATANFGWRAGYLLIALIVWGVTAVVIILIKSPRMYASHGKEKLKSNTTTYEQLRTSVFALLAISYALAGGWARQDFLAHLVSYLATVNFAFIAAVISLAVVGAGSAIGRLLSGALGRVMSERAVLSVCFLLQALSILSLMTFHNTFSIIISPFVFGIAWGGVSPQVPLLLRSNFGMQNFGIIFGLVMAGTGVGATFGPIVGGYLYDVTKGYTLSFLLDVLFSLVAAGLLLTPYERKRSIELA
jgi:MFS family permease